VRSAIVPAECLLVLGDLVDESELFRRVLCHSDDELCSEIFVSFSSDALKSFAADTGTNQLVVDGGIVYGNEAVGFEEVEKFIKKIVGIVCDELTEILDVGAVEAANAMTLGWCS
jgi:hypothetical protein